MSCNTVAFGLPLNELSLIELSLIELLVNQGPQGDLGKVGNPLRLLWDELCQTARRSHRVVSTIDVHHFASDSASQT